MERGRRGNAPQVTGHGGTLVVGGSAGSIEALVEVVARLPPGLPAAVLVTVHVGGNSRSSLPQVLARAGRLPAAHARNGEPLRRGRIYVAPPDLHLLAVAGTARLSGGPRVNRHRPAVDAMFASAARWGGDTVVAVVLSGVLDDGAVGAALVARAGGRVLVQDTADALFDSMPRAALSAVPGAVTAPAAGLASVIGTTFHDLLGGRGGTGVDEIEGEPEMAGPHMGDSDEPGFLSADETRLTRLSCPECNGGAWPRST
jgi:two-component system chemotaxis response regulator CheB